MVVETETDTGGSVEQQQQHQQQSAGSVEVAQQQQQTEEPAQKAHVEEEVQEEVPARQDSPVEPEQQQQRSSSEEQQEEKQAVVAEDLPVAKAEEEPVSNEPRKVEEKEPVAQHSAASANERSPSGGPLQLPRYVYAAMEKVGSQLGFTPGQFKIEFDVGSDKGDGFTGELFKAFLTEGDRREAYLCKIPPLNEARRRQFPTMQTFERETLAYGTILPRMMAYQEEKGVGREEGFFDVPKVYYAECDVESEESVIVMEDLRLDGYRMWNKMIPVNFEHARLAMEQLGRLHAVSLAMKRDRPEEFEQFKVSDPLLIIMPEGGPFMEMMKLMAQEAMETLEPHETKERAKMQKLLENIRGEMDICSNSALAEPHAVVGHGDCWVNNYMYTYKNGAPDKIVLLDWQVTRYVTPVLDLVYFIFCCTDEEFRRRHYDEIMNIYYNSLANLLEKLGHNPQEVFPRTALMRHLRRFGRFGLVMSLFIVKMMCTSVEDMPDMEQTAEKFREDNKIDMTHFTGQANDTAYRKRMSAVIRDTVRYGYL